MAVYVYLKSLRGRDKRKYLIVLNAAVASFADIQNEDVGKTVK